MKTLLRPTKPAGYEQRLVSRTQSDDDREYQVIDAASRPSKRQIELDLAVSSIEKQLADAHDARRRFYERNRLDLGTAAAIAPTEEHLSTFAEGALSLPDFLALDLPEPAWLVDQMIPAGGLGVLLAAEKTGKSLFALDCGAAIATGSDFYGRSTTQSNVLVIEQEGSPGALQHRVRKMFGPTPPTNLILRHRQPMDLTDADDLAGLQAYIDEHHIGLVFLGPLAQIGNVEDENSATAFNQIAQSLNAIISATGATIILIHHRRKPAQNDSYSAVGSFFNTSRGSSALMAAVDVAIGLQRAQEEAHGKMFVLLRDAPSSVGFYRFSFQNLRITATDNAPPNKTEERKSALVNYMLDNPQPLSRYAIEQALKISESAAGKALKAAVERGTIVKRGSGPSVTYELSKDYRTVLERDPKADSGLAIVAEETAA